MKTILLISTLAYFELLLLRQWVLKDASAPYELLRLFTEAPDRVLEIELQHIGVSFVIAVVSVTMGKIGLGLAAEGKSDSILGIKVISFAIMSVIVSLVVLIVKIKILDVT